jgi:hypothetical protein
MVALDVAIPQNGSGRTLNAATVAGCGELADRRSAMERFG